MGESDRYDINEYQLRRHPRRDSCSQRLAETERHHADSDVKHHADHFGGEPGIRAGVLPDADGKRNSARQQQRIRNMRNYFHPALAHGGRPPQQPYPAQKEQCETDRHTRDMNDFHPKQVHGDGSYVLKSRI